MQTKLGTKTKGKPDMKNLYRRGDTWHIKAMVDGVMIRKSLRTDDLSTARQRRDEILKPMQAHADERQLLTSVRRQLEGIRAEEERRRAEEARGIALDKAWQIFTDDPMRRACSKQTIDYHKSNWNRFLNWLKEHHPAATYCRDVTRAICTEWASEELKNARATNTYNHYISSVRYVFTSIANMDEDFKNPMSTIHKRKDHDCISKIPFTDDELRRIFASKDAEFVRLCAIGLYTTLRLGNARKLKWEMFSPDLMYLNATHTKTDVDASQRIAPELREKLSEVPPELRRGYVCPTFAILPKNSSAMAVVAKLNALGIQTHEERDGINDSVRVACVRGFHSFRHTAITLALRNGAGTPKTQKLAGHKSVLMQQRYTHLDADDAGDAAASIGRFW